MHAAHSGEQGCPEAVEEAELELDELDELDPLVKVDADEGSDVPCDFELLSFDFDLLLLSSPGSSGSSVLPGVIGSLGPSPDAPQSVPPPPPGGQKGHTQEGPWSPSPPLPPFHQAPPGPMTMIAADTVNVLPSLLVSVLHLCH